ncbi:MAG: MBL fold metallo-hydrolase, partial [Oscillospiraceae bacterium]
FLTLFGDRILFDVVQDGDCRSILGWETTFFDILSTKAKQFGFWSRLPDGKRLCCIGDEPCNPACERFIEDADWLLCEAFCLYADRERFRPYEKHHSTVKEACELAQRLKVKNLVLWHTEDKTYEQRRARYTAEGKEYFSGNLLVPQDLEVIAL